MLATGVAASLWSVLSKTGDSTLAYPEELLSLNSYTAGRVSEGQRITADNIALVKDLLDPIQAMQIEQLGRELNVVAQTTDMYSLNPYDYIEATLRNQGRARFDKTGNVVTDTGAA